MTEKQWPRTDVERVAAACDRLAEVLRLYGEDFLRKSDDYSRGFPAGGGDGISGGGSSIVETTALSIVDQLARDCQDARPAMKETHAHVSNLVDRILRVVLTHGDGHICHACGNPIDPKSEKAKFWRNKQPCHPVCYQRLQRAEKAQKKAS